MTLRQSQAIFKKNPDRIAVRILLFLDGEQAEDLGGQLGTENEEQKHGRDPADHDAVQFLAMEGIRALLDLIRNDFVPTTWPIRMQVRNATTGMRTEFEIKSKKSRNCMPMTVTPAHGP